MGTIELDTDNSLKKSVFGYDPGTTNKSGEGGDVIEQVGGQISWQCKNNGSSYLVWFYDFATGNPTWPFTTGPDPVPPPLPSIPGPPVTQFLRVNSKTPRVMTLNVTGAVKYWVLDDSDRTGVRWLDPIIVIRPMNLLASTSTDGVMLGVVCAALGAAVGAAVTYAMM
jgi:hypothetical protein